MKNLSILACAALIAVFASGCASIVSGTRQSVTINSNPPGAIVNINGQMGMTPATFELKRNEHYNVQIAKEGYQTQSMALSHIMNPWILGNVLLGGIIGLAVDLIDGAAYKHAPDNVMVTLLKKRDYAEHPPTSRQTAEIRTARHFPE
jgi:hypothetical protein